MARLLFYDDTHRYTIDGEEVPSVSELTRFIFRELYQEAPQYVVEGAAARGTKVHKATEALDKYGEVEIEDDLVEYLKAYVAFTKENTPEWEKIEWAVCNEKLYAGTLDRYGTVNGKKAIVDIKTTGTISGLHKVLYSAQLNLYRMAAQKEVEIEALYVLQLKKDGTYKLYELEMDDALPTACLMMHQSIAKTKRKRRKKRTSSSQ